MQLRLPQHTFSVDVSIGWQRPHIHQLGAWYPSGIGAGFLPRSRMHSARDTPPRPMRSSHVNRRSSSTDSLPTNCCHNWIMYVLSYALQCRFVKTYFYFTCLNFKRLFRRSWLLRLLTQLCLYFQNAKPSNVISNVICRPDFCMVSSCRKSKSHSMFVVLLYKDKSLGLSSLNK